MIISFDFFPALSQICESYNIKYVSWVYDWPNYTLFHKEAYNKCNRIFLFEREMALNYYRNIILIMYIIQVSQLI